MILSFEGSNPASAVLEENYGKTHMVNSQQQQCSWYNIVQIASAVVQLVEYWANYPKLKDTNQTTADTGRK